MDCPAPLPKDKFVAVANRATAGWQRKTKEFERKKKQQRQQAQERGEETDHDDDDDDVVLRKLHRLLDALRHFGGGSVSLTSTVPLSDAPGTMWCRGSARAISGATLLMW